MKKLCCVFVTILCVSVAGVEPAAAQEISLVGSVLDETDGALPGVTVTARHVSTGNVFLGVTDGTGTYRIGAMRPGEYAVEAVLSGFATIIQEQVELLVGQVGTLDFDMTVATVEETVTVTGESPLVDLQQSSLGGAINPLQMSELPVNGRDWMQLSMMAPGSRVNNTESTLTPGGRWGTDFQINIDGQPVTQTYSIAGLGQPKFSRDAIAEFEVVSSRFDATQGRSTGMQVNAVTKSGANQFSGSVGSFFRHDAMNAADFFADRVLPYQNQQVSLTFGGPIRQDKVHFFGYYEAEREPASYFFNSIVPEFNALGNGPDGNGLQFTERNHLYGGRMDFQLTDQTRLMGRFNGWESDTLRRPGRSLANHPTNLLAQQYTSFQAYGTLTRASGRIVNELKFGFNHFSDDRTSHFGIGSGLPLGPARHVRLTGIRIGPSFVSNGANQTQDNPSVRNDFTMLTGGHTLKIGGEVTIPSYYVYVAAERDGVIFAQGGPLPANVAELFPTIDPAGWSFDGLAPITTRFSQTSGRYDTHFIYCDDAAPDLGFADPENHCYRTKPVAGLWVQDDWQVSDNLTLNLGLRWDYGQDIMGNDIDYTQFRAPQFANDPVRQAVGQFYDLFQPRVGFAYALNDNRTVVRGGYGLYYSGINDVSAIHTEFPLAFLTFENLNDGRPDFVTNPYGNPVLFPNGRRPTHQETIDGALAGQYLLDLSSYGPITLDDAGVRYSQQVTIGFQQQIGNTASFQADYVFIGSRGGLYPKNANLTWDPATGVNNPYSDIPSRRWPDLGLIRIYDHGKDTDYHGVEMALTKRFDQGYQLSATYTVGQSESCSPPADFENSGWTGPRDLGLDCWFSTVSDAGASHQRHRAVFNGIVDLGYDFQLSGLYFFGSGQRYDSYNQADRRNTGGYFIPWPAMASRLEADGSILDAGAVVGDPLHRVDVRLMRRFNLGQVRIDGIVEVFNLFNHENYGNYGGNSASSSFRQPLSNPDVAYQPRDRAAGVPGRLLSRAPGV